ncbi:hypothetical protein H311_01931 [Anncaliia algerae PRA109]|nr:hypothetical protein H311_01931 [Anncaliia algerae PRA109]
MGEICNLSIRDSITQMLITVRILLIKLQVQTLKLLSPFGILIENFLKQEV